MENGKVRKVGVNCHRVEEEEPKIEFHPFREEDCRTQIARLEKVRRERDSAAVKKATRSISLDAGKGRNVMPAILEAVKSYATVGEITGSLVDVFGRYKEPIRF